MSLIRINIFGKAKFISCGSITVDEWHRMLEVASNEGLTLEHAFFSPWFLSRNGFFTSNGTAIKEWHSVNDFFQCLLFLPDARSTMQIKVDGKSLRKIPLSQLLPESSLFPFFEMEEKEIDFDRGEEDVKRILLCEDRTGLTGHFTYSAPSFDITQLRLERTTINIRNVSTQYISGIFYGETKLMNSRDDYLVTGWSCEEVK